jgi:hypothetical protein
MRLPKAKAASWHAIVDLGIDVAALKTLQAQGIGGDQSTVHGNDYYMHADGLMKVR